MYLYPRIAHDTWIGLIRPRLVPKLTSVMIMTSYWCLWLPNGDIEHRLDCGLEKLKPEVPTQSVTPHPRLGHSMRVTSHFPRMCYEADHLPHHQADQRRELLIQDFLLSSHFSVWRKKKFNNYFCGGYQEESEEVAGCLQETKTK